MGPSRAQSAREIAAEALAQHAERFPDLIPLVLETDHLEERDAALAHAIVDAAVRRWVTLTYLLDGVLRQPFAQLEASVQGLLLSGAAQLLLLDRIPAHAAINETVEMAKRGRGRGAGGLVNAVLRKVAAMRGGSAGEEAPAWAGERDRLPMAGGGAIRLAGVLLPEGDLERLGVATSHAKWLLERWQREHRERVQELALHSLVAPPTILNTAHITGELPEGAAPHESAGHHVWQGGRGELLELLRSRRDLWVQDPASNLAVQSAGRLRPRLVVDACAGQGTKTRQLAAVFPEAEVVATDVDPGRFQTLARIHGGSGRVRVLAPERVRMEYAGKADLVLLDVPCSNSGVLARRPEAKYRAGEAQLKRLTQIQRQIIADAVALLAPGGGGSGGERGRILYSTCSIDRSENQEIVEWAVRQHGFRVEDQRLTLPAGAPGDDPREYHDGSFSALLA